MMANILTSVFGSANQRLLKRYGKVVKKTNALESEFEQMTDERLRAKTEEFRERLEGGAELDSLIPEAFAAVREAARRTLGLRHYDVQLIGGMTLHEGKIAEMRTGEGKTLVATLAAYLNALPGKGVHVVTVNEYLAGRDAEWMGPIYRFLGLEVSAIRSGQDPVAKREAYSADITYGTNNEFGFDYLRDNLAFRIEDKVQRDLAFSIVDEVDSILIDEARTPLIISGPADGGTELYARVNGLVPRLKRQADEEGEGDFWVDEKAKQVHLSEDGLVKVEELLVQAKLLDAGESLYAPANIGLLHHLTAGLRAHSIYQRDVEYIVKDGQVVIVDEFTGRTMPGRRWGDGLHQAIEAKEGLRVNQENQTLASITFQNYFRMYDKLSGMTGTADTEAFEFQQIYGLEVAVIPTNRDMVRKDEADLVFLNEEDKFISIVEDIKDCHERGQPVLVGTTSIDNSERLAAVLRKEKIPHEVLNAKQHEREATIVAQAGRPGAITIATNMAGRGTDIVLGGNLDSELSEIAEDDAQAREAAKKDWEGRHSKVLEAGGLHIIGTERHESRRIDNQLRGRSGRQGDPGSSRFFLSMEDSLMRIFGNPERTQGLLKTVGMKPGEAIESKMLSGQIERAQRKVEAHNFDMRKALLEYDDVANEQRKVVYSQRGELMSAEEIEDAVHGIREEVVNREIDNFIPRGSVEEQWDISGLAHMLESDFGAKLELQQWLDTDDDLNEDGLRAKILQSLDDRYAEKVERYGAEIVRRVEATVMLGILDQYWKEHLAAMDYLRQGIGLRSYAQKNPKQEYKREAFEMFSDMLERVKTEVTKRLCMFELRTEADPQTLERQREAAAKAQLAQARAAQEAAPGTGPAAPGQAPSPARAAGGGGGPAPAAAAASPVMRSERKVGRNEPCPCGSGKKFKQCHGKLS
ncbi:MAG: preprotein translocase subunit SecA [Pseudomonadota bacterium]